MHSCLMRGQTFELPLAIVFILRSIFCFGSSLFGCHGQSKAFVQIFPYPANEPEPFFRELPIVSLAADDSLG
jgi:hypothetical protein